MRIYQLIVLIVAFVASPSELLGADSPKLVSPTAVKSQIPKELAQEINLSDLRRDRLIPLLRVLEEKRKIKIEIDQSGIEKACGTALDQIDLDVPRLHLPLAIALELVATQVHGTLVSESGRWRIKPGAGNSARFLSPPSQKMRAKHLQPATIEKPIQNIVAQDVFEFLSEKYEVPIVVAPQLFDRAIFGRPGLRICTLPSGTRSLLAWINGMTSQIGAEVQEFEELILIVPIAKRE